MKAMIANFVPLVLAAGMLAPSAQAAEPTLAEILQGIEASTWSQVDYDDFINAGWNQVGQQLTFTIAAEYTAHAAIQEFWLDATFTPDIHGYGTTIFIGSDAPGATSTVTLQSIASRVFFNSNLPDQYAPGGSAGDLQVWQSSSGRYALAYEDWIHEAPDYNDFVVTISAVPEPESAVMLVIGLALIGMFGRRKHPV